MSYFAAMFGDQVKYSFKRKIHSVIVMGWMLVFLVSACREEKAPANLLSEEQMVKILTEIYLLEDKAGRTISPSDSLQKVFPQFSAELFGRLEIADSVFKQSLEYYKAHPKQLEHIYTALVDSLSLKAQSLPTPNTNDLPK